jgi:hypothetical protein
MFRTPLVRVLLASVLLIAACDQPGAPPDPLTTDVVAPARPALAGSLDLERLAGTVEGFGGLYFDQRGALTVYLTDVAEAPLARQSLALVALQNGHSANDIVIRQAAHKYENLKKWYDASWAEALDVPGAVFSDLDEANNRLLFGVQDAASEKEVRKALKRMGVPDDMVAVQEVEPIAPAATLRDHVTSTQGGLQIHFSNFLCTLGFNASFGGTASFITNSHCTNRQGGVDDTEYFQPLSTVNPTIIAIEVADPAYFRRGLCPKGRRCRFSDSSRANYSAGVASDLGSIAATALGSITITGSHSINGEADGTTSPVPAGQTVSKVGRTTGTSSGAVTNTCVNTNVSGTNITQLCQTFVSAAVGGGDSGSPVFTGTGNITLVGILWGGNGTGTQFVFSPLKSIKDELGTFAAH